MTKRAKTPASKGVASAAQRKLLYIEEFIRNGGNGRAAALHVGAKTERAADVYAQRMSSNEQVQAEIKARKAEVLKAAEVETGISASKTLREVGRLAYVDLAQCFDEHGNALNMGEIPPEVRAAIAGFEMDEMFTGKGEERQHIGYTKKFKFHDKNSALDKLMKHFGLYEADNDQQPAALPPQIIVVGVPAKGGRR